jgi:hypothetical protein
VLLSFNSGLQSELFQHLAAIGLPVPTSPEGILRLRLVAVAVAVPLFATYGWSIWDDARRRGGWNVPKLTYFFSLLGGHLLMNTTSSILLLSCHEKIYHSSQYVVLVHHYNQNRVKNAAPEETTRLFRLMATPAGIPIYLGVLALYVLAIVALDPSILPRNVYSAPGYTTVAIVLALTHYYYDSFLWRVRRKEVRASL